MTEYDKIGIQRKSSSIYLCIGFDNGDNNIKVEIPKFMQDDIIKEFCKDDYMVDIKFFIKENNIRATDEQREAIFEKYFSLRQEADSGWRECLWNAVNNVIPCKEWNDYYRTLEQLKDISCSIIPQTTIERVEEGLDNGNK